MSTGLIDILFKVAIGLGLFGDDLLEDEESKEDKEKREKEKRDENDW